MQLRRSTRRLKSFPNITEAQAVKVVAKAITALKERIKAEEARRANSIQSMNDANSKWSRYASQRNATETGGAIKQKQAALAALEKISKKPNVKE